MPDKEHIDKIIERLNIVFARSQKTIEEFSTPIGVERGQFGKVLNGKMGVTLKQILDISSQYQIRVGWLLDGEDPMYINKKSGPSQEPDIDLLTLKERVTAALLNLQEVDRMLPEPSGPGTNAVPDSVRVAKTSDKTKTNKKQGDR